MCSLWLALLALLFLSLMALGGSCMSSFIKPSERAVAILRRTSYVEKLELCFRWSRFSLFSIAFTGYYVGHPRKMENMSIPQRSTPWAL